MSEMWESKRFQDQAISQLDCSIHIKLNYQILLTVVGFDRMVSAWKKISLHLITWVGIVTSPSYPFAKDKFK
jgi:hypothetical protein